MLPKQLRLTEREAFRRVYEAGRSWGHPLLILYTLPQPPPARRFGFAVGKSVGSAVRRNRVRRRLREIGRALAPRVRGGVDLVVIARPAAGSASFAQLFRALEELLTRASALAAAPEEAAQAPYAWPAGGRRPEERAGRRPKKTAPRKTAPRP